MNQYVLYLGATIMVGFGFMLDHQSSISVGLGLMWIGSAVSHHWRNAR